MHVYEIRSRKRSPRGVDLIPLPKCRNPPPPMTPLFTGRFSKHTAPMVVGRHCNLYPGRSHRTCLLYADSRHVRKQLEERSFNPERRTKRRNGFLFKTLINEAELRHLEGLASPYPYPLEKTGFAEKQLDRLRASRLITVPSGITRLPEHIGDLHEHAALTKAARYYLERRKTLKLDNVA
jgi:hypothetical protein